MQLEIKEWRAFAELREEAIQGAFCSNARNNDYMSNHLMSWARPGDEGQAKGQLFEK